ncbi:hypothetical protein WDU94_007364 [Cyamophila willieti]
MDRSRVHHRVIVYWVDSIVSGPRGGEPLHIQPPNPPRVMNVSLLNKVDKPKHTTPTTPGAPGERRGSKSSPPDNKAVPHSVREHSHLPTPVIITPTIVPATILGEETLPAHPPWIETQWLL